MLMGAKDPVHQKENRGNSKKFKVTKPFWEPKIIKYYTCIKIFCKKIAIIVSLVQKTKSNKPYVWALHTTIALLIMSFKSEMFMHINISTIFIGLVYQNWMKFRNNHRLYVTPWHLFQRVRHPSVSTPHSNYRLSESH
jgi:hypothetical protein